MSQSDMQRISQSKPQILSIYNSILKTFDIVSGSTCGIHNACTRNVYDKIQVIEHYFKIIYQVHAKRDIPECSQAIEEIIRLIKMLFAIHRPDYPHIFNDLDMLNILKNSSVRDTLNKAQALDYQERVLKYEAMEIQIGELNSHNDQLSKNICDLTDKITSYKVMEAQLSKLTNENEELIRCNKILTDEIDNQHKFTISIPAGTNLIMESNCIKTLIVTNTEKVIDVIDNTKVRINDCEYSIINPSMPANLTNLQPNTVKIIQGEPIIINGMFQSIAHVDLDLKIFGETVVTLSAGTKLRDTNGICTVLCQATVAII